MLAVLFDFIIFSGMEIFKNVNSTLLNESAKNWLKHSMNINNFNQISIFKFPLEASLQICQNKNCNCLSGGNNVLSLKLKNIEKMCIGKYNSLLQCKSFLKCFVTA